MLVLQWFHIKSLLFAIDPYDMVNEFKFLNSKPGIVFGGPSLLVPEFMEF